jgi:MATE family multidrug resistance protein
MWDGIFVGLTLTRYMLYALLAAVAVFFATLAAMQPAYGNHALWLAFILYLATRSLVQTILFHRRNL